MMGQFFVWQKMNHATLFSNLMERAGRKGTKAHIPLEVVRHIIAHPVWLYFMEMRQQEVVSQWTSQVSHLALSPSTDAESMEAGAPDGTIPPEIKFAIEQAAVAKLNRAISAVRKQRRRQREASK